MLRGKSMGVTEEHRARRVVGPPSHLRAGFKSKQPGGSFGKESACNTGDPGSIPGSGRSPGEGNGNPLQLFLPRELHGERSLMGYSLWDSKESDTTE